MRLGDMLIAAGLATDEQIRVALDRQKQTGRRLGEELVELGFVSEAQVTQVLSNQLSIPWVSLYHVEFSRELLNLIPAELAERHGLIPVYVRKVRQSGETLFVAMDDPTNEDVLGQVRQVTGMPVKPMVAAPSDIRNAIRVYYFGGRPRRPEGLAPETTRHEAPAPGATPLDDAEAMQRTSDAPSMEDVSPESPEPVVEQQAPPADATSDAGAPGTGESAPRANKPRMVTLTLLDGTTVRLPAPSGKKKGAPASEGAASSSDDESGSLTAYDLVAALAGRAQGADVSDVLPDDRWEPMFAALLSVLLRKGLVADWEFVEEWRKRQG